VSWRIAPDDTGCHAISAQIVVSARRALEGMGAEIKRRYRVYERLFEPTPE
jgi:hypothetical protein